MGLFHFYLPLKLTNTINYSTTMKLEDFVSQEDNIATKCWNFPLSKKHCIAIASTATLAVFLSAIAPKQNYSTTSKDISFSSENTTTDLLITDDALIAEKTENIANDYDTIINEQSSKAEVIAAENNIEKAQDVLQTYQLAEQSQDGIAIDDEVSDVYLDDSYDEQLAKELASTDDENGIENQIRNLATNINDSTVHMSTTWFMEKVQKGDTLASIFSDFNIPYSTLQAINNIKGIDPDIFRVLKIGTPLSFLFDENNKLLALALPINSAEQIRIYREDISTLDFTFTQEPLNVHLSNNNQKVVDKDGNIIPISEIDKPVTPTYKKRGKLVAVTIQKGEAFSTAANRAGLTYNEINQISNLFKGRIQFSKHIQAGDTIRVLFSDAKGEGKMNAIEFELAKLGNISSFRNPVDDEFYDENGYNSSSGTFRRIPLNGKVRISSHFSPRRLHPVLGKVKAHNGTDFAIPVGTPVLAPADGVVTLSKYSSTAGHYIKIRHNGNYSTVYMHLSKRMVKVGDRVRIGQTIARSGNTGRSTGPHLHYELRINGKPVNSQRVSMPHNTSAVVAKNQRKKFNDSVTKYKKELHQDTLIAKLD